MVDNTSKHFSKVGKYNRPKFRKNTLLTTWHLNYFKPVEVPKKVLLRNGLMKETIILNPLTGLVEVSGIFFLSVYNKPKYTKPYRLWSTNELMRDKLNKYLGLDIERNLISIELTSNNPNTVEESFEVARFGASSISIKLPISIKKEFIDKIVDIKLNNAHEELFIDDYKTDRSLLTGFDSSDMAILANRDVRTISLKDIIKREVHIVDDKEIYIKNNLGNAFERNNNGVDYVKYNYKFIPKTDDLVDLYEKLNEESTFNNIYDVNEFADDLLSDELYDDKFLTKVVRNEDVKSLDELVVENDETETITYGLAIDTPTKSFTPIYGFAWVPHIAFMPDSSLYNLRFTNGVISGYDWVDSAFTDINNPKGLKIRDDFIHIQDNIKNINYITNNRSIYGKIGEELDDDLVEANYKNVPNRLNNYGNYYINNYYNNVKISNKPIVNVLNYNQDSHTESLKEKELDKKYTNYLDTSLNWNNRLVRSREELTSDFIETNYLTNIEYINTYDPIYRSLPLTSYLRDVFNGGAWLTNNLYVIRNSSHRDSRYPYSYDFKPLHYRKFVEELIGDNDEDVSKYNHPNKLKVYLTDGRDPSTPKIHTQFDEPIHEPGKFSFAKDITTIKNGIFSFRPRLLRDRNTRLYIGFIEPYKGTGIANNNYNINVNHRYLNNIVNQSNPNNSIPWLYSINKNIYRPTNVNIKGIFPDYVRKPFASEEDIRDCSFIFNLPLNVENKLSKRVLKSKLMHDVTAPLPTNFADFPFNRVLPKLLNTHDAINVQWVNKFLNKQFVSEEDKVTESINTYHKSSITPEDKSLVLLSGTNEYYNLKSIANRLSFINSISKDDLMYKYNINGDKTRSDEMYIHGGGLPSFPAPPSYGKPSATYIIDSTNLLNHPVYLYVVGMYNILYDISNEYHSVNANGDGYKASTLMAPHQLQTATAFALATGVSSYFYKQTTNCSIIDSLDNFYSVDKESYYNNLTYYPSLSSYLSGITPLYTNSFKYRDKSELEYDADYTIEKYSNFINENEMVPKVVKYKPNNFHQYITDTRFHEVGRMLTAFLLADWCEIKFNLRGVNKSYKRINNNMVRFDINGTDGNHFGSPIIEDIGTNGTSMNNLIVNTLKTRPEDLYNLDIRNFHGGFGFGIKGTVSNNTSILENIADLGDLFHYMDFAIPCMYLGNRTFEHHYVTGMGPYIRYNYHETSDIYKEENSYKHYAISNYNELDLIKGSTTKKKEYKDYLEKLSEIMSLPTRSDRRHKNDGIVYKDSIFKDLMKAQNIHSEETMTNSYIWDTDAGEYGNIEVTIDFHFNPMFEVPNNKASFTFHPTYPEFYV